MCIGKFFGTLRADRYKQTDRLTERGSTVKDKLQRLPFSTHAQRIERDKSFLLMPVPARQEWTIHDEDTVLSATHTSNWSVLPAGDRRKYTLGGVSSNREVFWGFIVDCTHKVKPVVHV